MKYGTVAIVLFLLIGLTACTGQKKGSVEVGQISVEELVELRKINKGVLLDVRTTKEVEQGFIDGAEFLDYYSNDFKESITKYSKNTPIYIYCRSGNRSNKSADIFIEKGFVKVYNVKGGFKAWVSGNNKITKK